jgi:hypothetical protein
MTSVVITQSNYMPWRGWYAMVRASDILVYLDDVQFTRRDWRNRNLIAGKHGPMWLTIPVNNSGNYHSKIHEMRYLNRGWWRSHLSKIDGAYKDVKGYQDIKNEIREAFQRVDGVESLSEINSTMNRWIFSVLGIRTETRDSRDFPSSLQKSERLVAICQSVGATEYVSGPAARSYLDEALFSDKSIAVRWVDYGKLPSLSQAEAPNPELSILHHLATGGSQEAIRLSTFVPNCAC